MITIELQSVSGGWDTVKTPDDVDFELRKEDERHDLWASIQELLELYVRLRQGESGEVLLGSTAFATVDANRDRVQFRTRGATVEAPIAEGRAALERLLKSIISKKNAMGPTEKRDERLDSIERHLERKGIECDVSTVYEELLGE